MALLKKLQKEGSEKHWVLASEPMRIEEAKLSDVKANSNVCPLLAKAWPGIAR